VCGVTALLYLLGVLFFVVGVAASIGLHELGHLIPGKLYNVKVTQYFVGFGRTIWSRRRGETEYGVKAIPLGGYVKLVGMLPPEPGEDPSTIRSRPTGMFAQLVDDARTAEYEHVGPHDHDRLFYKLPWWKRVVVMGSGVATNLLLAVMLFSIAFMGIGVITASTTVGKVSVCVKVVKADATPGKCTSRDQETPASRAGLRPGDRITSFNGTAITSYGELQTLIRANGGSAAAIGIVRSGKALVLHTDTAINSVPNLDDPDKSVRAGFLGIEPTLVRQHQSFGYVISNMVDATRETLKTIGALPVKLYHVARASVGLEKRSADSPMSVVGAGRVAGSLASDTQNSVANRIAELLSLLAGLNLFLGLINLVPLPPFDGGQIATTLYEAVRRRIARLLGRPDPGGVDSAKLLPLTYAMAMVILVVSVILIYADIVAPVRVT